jgi:hypothetical protein
LGRSIEILMSLFRIRHAHGVYMLEFGSEAVAKRVMGYNNFNPMEMFRVISQCTQISTLNNFWSYQDTCAVILGRLRPEFANKLEALKLEWLVLLPVVVAVAHSLTRLLALDPIRFFKLYDFYDAHHLVAR